MQKPRLAPGLVSVSFAIAVALSAPCAAQNLSSVALSPTSVTGGSNATGTVTLSANAPTGGKVVTLSSGSPAAATVPSSVTVAAGKKTATFTVTTAPQAANASAVVSAVMSGVTKTATLTVKAPATSAASVSPTSVAGGTDATLTVTLTGNAPGAGTTVALASGNTGAATLPASVVVTSGTKTKTVPVTTYGVDANASVALTASAGGVSKSATLTVSRPALTGLAISPTTIPGGGAASGTVTLSGPAGPSGAVVALSSSDPGVAAVPPSVVVPAGAASADFTVSGAGVGEDALATITATLDDESRSAEIVVTRTIGALRGTVTDATTGFTFPGAHVVLASDPGRDTWTDGLGEYRFDDVAAGEHTVEVDADRHAPATSATVTVEAGQVATVPPVELVPEPGTITGFVVDGDDGNAPIADALVTETTGLRTVTTDQDGRFELTGLSQGFTSLVVHKEGYFSNATDVLGVDAGRTTEAVVGLSPRRVGDRDGTIEGFVRDAAGEGLGGVTVSVFGVPGLSVTTGDDGRYELTVPAAYAWILEAGKPGYRRVFSRWIRASAGDLPYHVTQDISLPLEAATGTVEILTRSLVSRTPGGTDLAFRTPAGWYHAPVPESGSRTVAGVPAGLVWDCLGVRTLPEGGLLTIRCPGSWDVPEGFPRWAAAGMVVDQYSGEPLEGATATFVGETASVEVTTDSSGLFSYAGGPEGDWAVTVTAPGFLPAGPWEFTAAHEEEHGNVYGAWFHPETPGGTLDLDAPANGSVLTEPPTVLSVGFTPDRPGDQLLWVRPWFSAGNVASVTPAFSADGRNAVLSVEAAFWNGPLTIAVEAGTQSGAILSVERNVTLSLSSRPTALAVTPASVSGGSFVTGRVVIDPPSPAGGTVVALSSDDAAVSVPASVLVSEGGTEATFQVVVSPVEAARTATITATAGGSSVSASVTVNSTSPPPLDVDLAEGSLSGWTAFADPPAVASVSADTTHVQSGAVSLRFVTDSGGDCGVRYDVPPGAHWDLRGVRFLSFWSRGETAEAFQGEQPVVVLRGPGGSIRYQPPTVETLNGEWRLHRVPLGDASDWTVTTEGEPSLGDVTAIEIHQDVWGAGMSVTYDGIAFVSEVPEDLAEGTAALWGTFASDGAATSVVDDAADTRSGASALRFETASGFDTGVVFPSQTNARWDLSDVRTLTFWARAESSQPFQGNQPVVVLRSPSGSIRLEPGDVLLGPPHWRFFEVPLDGAFPWTRTQEGTPDLTNVTGIEFHTDTWGAGFRLWVDGVSVGRPLPLLVLPAASAAEGATFTATVHLSSAAPVGGRTVLLETSDPAVASIPSSVVVLEGERSASFTVTTGAVAVPTGVVLTATDRDAAVRADLKVTPIVDVASLTLGASSVVGGLPVSGSLTLASPAAEGGVSVLLASSDPSAASVPAAVTVPASSTTASFSVATLPVESDRTVTLTADAGGVSKSASLTVLAAPPPTVAGLTLNPATVLPGNSAMFSVALAAPAPLGGVVVTLSAAPSGLVSLPSTLLVPGGATLGTATVDVPPAMAPSVVTITASIGSSTLSAVLTIAPPPSPLAVSISPASVTPASVATGTVIVDPAAPPGGILVQLSSSSPAVALPSSVTIPDGAPAMTFPITAGTVETTTVAVITATAAGLQATATLTVIPVAPPPLDTDLAEGSLSGWTAFADPPAVASISVGTTHVKSGTISLGLVTSGGGDAGVRYTVPPGSHWDPRGIRFLTFWSRGETVEPLQGAQPVVVLRGPAGSIRYQPTAVQTLNGAWRFHRVPLEEPGDWIVTRQNGQSLGDLTALEIHQSAPGAGMTITYDGIAFSSEVAEDLAEGTAALWRTFASDGAAASVVDDAADTRSGASALRLDTGSGFDTGLAFPARTHARWDLTDVRTLVFWARGENAQPFQGNQPIVVLRSPSGSIRLEPGDVLLGPPHWRFFEVPLDGAFPWTRTQEGTPDLTNVNGIEIHGDTWGYGFRLYVDGVSVGRPLPLLVLPETSAPEGSSVPAAIHLSSAAPAGGLTVLLETSDSAVASLPPSVVVPEGSRSAAFTVTTGDVGDPTSVVLTATDRGASVRSDLRVTPSTDVASVSLGAASAIGGLTVTGTVTLGAPAGQGGVAVLLGSSDASSASVPAAILVPASSTTASFSVATAPVQSDRSVTLTATAGGVPGAASLTVLVAPPPTVSAATLSPATVSPGQSTSLSVVLAAPAPLGGVYVTLSATPSGLFSLPSTLLVPGGASLKTVSIVVPTAAGPSVVTVTATIGGSAASAELTIAPPASLVGVSFSRAWVTVGDYAGLTATLTTPAPAAGKTISLSSSNPAALLVPATMSIPEGSSSAAISIQAPLDAPHGTVTVSAFDGAITRAASVAVTGLIRPADLSFTPNTGFLGESVTGTLTLTFAAPPGGYEVELSSSNPGLVSVPGHVVVPAGALSTTFPAVLAQAGPGGTATIWARDYGITRSASVGVVALAQVGISASPAVSGMAVSVQVSLSAAVPPGRVVEVALTSSAPDVVPVPPTVLIPAGAISTSFPVVLPVVATDTPVELTATALGVVKTRTVVVQPLKVVSVVSRAGKTSVEACREDVLRIRTNANAPAEGATILVSVENGHPWGASSVSGSSPPAFRFTLPAGSSTLDVRVRASWGTEPRQLATTATLGPSQVTHSMPILPGTVLANASPSPAPRGSTVRVVLRTSGETDCYYTPSVDASASSNNPAVLDVPATVRFTWSNELYAWFANLTVPPTAPSGVARLTFGALGTTASVDVTVPESAITDLTVLPKAAPAGAEVTGRVTLDSLAPPGGALVLLESTDSSRVFVPATIAVPAGASSVAFQVSVVGSVPGSATITATYQGVFKSARVAVLSSDAVRVLGRIVDESWWDYVPGLGSVVVKDPAGREVTTSAEDGTFWAWLEADTTAITIEKADFVSRSVGPLSLSTGFPMDLGVIGMDKVATGGCRVFGRVVDTVGEPIEGAAIKLVGYDLSSTTGPDGGFALAGPFLGRHRIRVSKEGFATVVHDVTRVDTLYACDYSPPGDQLEDIKLPVDSLPEATAMWAYPPVVEHGATPTLRAMLSGQVPSYGGRATYLYLTNNIAGGGYRAGPSAALTVAGAGPELVLSNLPAWVGLRNDNSTAAPFTRLHAFFYGGATKVAEITYLPAGQKAFYVSCVPPTVRGGGSRSCEVRIGSDSAPAEGLPVSLAISSQLASVPASVVIPAGQSFASFGVSTSPVSSLVPVTITATSGDRTASVVLELTPAALVSVSSSSSRCLAGSSATGTIHLSGTAPEGGLSVQLNTDSGNVSMPPSVPVSAGASSASFPIGISASSPAGLARITAVLAGRSRSLTLDIGPPRVASLGLTPTSLQAGGTVVGTVFLDMAAPEGGASVSLTSSDPTVAQVPISVVVPASATHSTFSLTTSPVTATRSVTITASLSGSSRTATLEVRVAPPTLTGAAPGVALPGTSGIVVYGTGLAAATGVLLSGPVYPIGGTTPVCNIRGAVGPFCPEILAVATPSPDGRTLTFSLPANAATGTYLLEARVEALLSTNGVPFLIEEQQPRYEVVAPEDHKFAQRIYPGQTVEGILAGSAPNCPFGATDYNQYFFFGTAGSRINVRMERVDTSVPWSDPSSLDPQIEIVAPDGFIYGNLTRFNDRPGVDYDATITNAVLPQTGLYVILAETARGAGEYRLSFSFSSLAPAPPDGRVIPVAGNHLTARIGDTIISWAAILDPRGHPLTGANVTFEQVVEPGDGGTIQFTSGADTRTSSAGVASVEATLTSYGRVRFAPVLQHTYDAPASNLPEAPALTSDAPGGARIPLYPAVAMRPFSVGHFDGQSLAIESRRFERFPLRAAVGPRGPVEEPPAGRGPRTLGAGAGAPSLPQPYGAEAEARGEVPVARYGIPGLDAPSCQDGLRFHAFAALPSAQINAPLTVTLEDLTPSTGESTPNGPVGDKGIYGHRIEKEIRLRIRVLDAAGNEPDYPVLVSVSVGGWAAGRVILDPDGARIECPTATFIWHQRDENGAIVALNDVVGYELGTYSDFVGVDSHLRPVWNWTELFQVKTFTPGQEAPSLNVFGVYPEPGKPDQLLCRKPNGESCGEVHRHWTGYLARENGRKADGTPRYSSGIHATLTAYRLVDSYENDTYGYFDTAVAESIPSTDVEFVPHAPGEVLSSQLNTYKLRVSWTNDPAWPSGSYPAMLSVQYPADPDWAAGDVSKEVTFSFETGPSRALSRHTAYDLIRPDGTRGIDDGAFPIKAYAKATEGVLPKTEVGDGVRLVLLAYRGDVVPGEAPYPEPTEAGLRMWQPEGDHWVVTETRASSFLETAGPSPLRFSLIDSGFNVIQDGAFVVHRCPRFDHSAPGAARPCGLPPVASVNGVIDELALNPAGAGAADSRGYLGIELTRAPEGLGLYYVQVESLSQEYRIRRQSDLMSTSVVGDGEYLGAFKLVSVDDYPCPDPRCGIPECGTCTGSPNYVSTGTYTTSATDLVVPTSGPTISVSRRYVSTPTFDGVVGPGWTSSLEARVYLAPYLSGGVRLGTEANVVLPNGMRYKFRLNPFTGHYDPPAGREDDLLRNADGSFDLFLERGSGSVYRFDKHGRLASETDEYGNVVSWERDAEGRVSRLVDLTGTGRSVTVGWTGAGRLHTLTDSAGRTVTYDYDAGGRLAGVTDPGARRTRYDYARGRYSTALLTRIADPWGRAITDVTYDDYDRTKSYTEQGATYTYTYAAADRTRKTDDSGHSTENYFDPVSGAITARSDPADSFNKVFDSEGRPVQVTDAANVITTYTYDDEGHVLSVTRNATQPGAVRYDYTYDPAFPDKVGSVTPRDPGTNALDPAWQAWRYEYHPAGSTRPGGLKKVYRVASDGTTADAVSEYEYDGQGRVTRQTTAGGAQTDYDYDGAGNLQAVTGPASSGARPVTTYQHDALGRVTDVTDPLGKVTRYTYDPLGRVLSVTLPPAGGRSFTTTYSYDHLEAATGLLYTEITDPNGRLTRLGYDVDGRLRRSVDAAGGTTLYGYTGRFLTTITDPNGNVTAYAYDAAKRLSSTSFPDGGQETYTYWNDGLLRTKTDRRGTTVTYAYDAFKRLKKKSYSTGGEVTYAYEGQKLLTVTDTTVSPAETHSFAYDARYRLASAGQAGRGTIDYTYTPDDRVETLEIATGPTATYGYNPDGSLASLQWDPVAGAFAWGYTARGQYDTLTFPNGQTRTYGYDDQGRLTTLSNALGGATLAGFTYGYDVDLSGQPTLLGQRTSQTTTLPAQGLTNALTRYGYDDLYQLTRAEYPASAPFGGQVHTWTYDSIGNRLTQGMGANVQTYTYLKSAGNPLNGQRLMGDGADAMTYDPAGNLQTRVGPAGSFTFGYDPENRLASITGPEPATYTYDYQGRRTSKTVDGVTTTYLYDGLNLVAETTGGQTTYFLNGPGIDEPLAMSKNGAVSYFSVDGLGSVVATNDPTGAVTHSVLFDAWGNVKAETGTRTHPFTYTAREVGEAGFHFYRARFYQPSVGRFIQEDPLHDVSAERHWYRYARNQPTTGRDPSGLWTVGIFVDGQGGAGAGGGLSKIYVFDGHGNVGVQYSAAAGGVGGAGASATVGIQVTNAETICDLKGFTGNPGVGLGEVVVLGVDALIAETYKGGQVSVGLGATAPGFAIPAVFYGFGSWTTMGFHVNVYDLLQRIYGDKVEFGLTPSPTDPQCSCKRN